MVRVLLANASSPDCVFEVNRPTTEVEVNGLLKAAAENELKDQDCEERPGGLQRRIRAPAP